MKSVTSYFRPVKKNDPAPTLPNDSATNRPPGQSPNDGRPSYSGLRQNSGGSSIYPPEGLRPSAGSRQYSSNSQSYPTGDWRNSAAGEIADIKCEVMVNWLHTKQQELLWIGNGYDEGVILKKSRKTFISCPSELSLIRGQLFDAVEKLNVRVSSHNLLMHSALSNSEKGCYDSEYRCHQVFPTTTGPNLYSSRRRPLPANFTEYCLPSHMPETSIRSVHSGFSNFGCLGR